MYLKIQTLQTISIPKSFNSTFGHMNKGNVISKQQKHRKHGILAVLQFSFKWELKNCFNTNKLKTVTQKWCARGTDKCLTVMCCLSYSNSGQCVCCLSWFKCWITIYSTVRKDWSEPIRGCTLTIKLPYK